MSLIQKIDGDFLPDVELALRGQVHRFAYLLTMCVIAFFVVFVVWGNFATLDEVTRGAARVVPSQRVQIIQNLEGGILSEMLVHDGQIVQKGDVLLRIANSTAEAAYRDSRFQELTLKAMMARLTAETEDKAPVVPADVEKEAPQIVSSERALYNTQIAQLKTAVGVLQDQLTQRQQNIAELKTRQEALSRSLTLAKKARDITAPLIAKGAAAQLDLVKIEQQVSDLEGQLAETQAQLPRAQAARDEAQRRIQEKIDGFHADARAELNRHSAELQALTQKAFAEKDRVQRTEVRSPVRGVIKDIKINTIGAAIQPGQDLVEIVPLDDTLLVEAKIRPSDVAFLHPGQNAMVKITAYDFAVYGGLKAQLERISADSINEQTGDRSQTFFRVMLRTDKNYLSTPEHPLPIMPGMTAQVEILTGHRTVLDYLLKPILDAKDHALTER
ncbi:MAG: HlyD family type I secretion periplasmic adaptor subunit [Alphaproteobacteria bacterium]|nr:HlyD family type I secretion periplasmic adaptor subunit [Alphaproteobacteria bacterium]